MTDQKPRNPLTDPQPGDVIRAVVGSKCVTRRVLNRDGQDVTYSDPRYGCDVICYVSAWKRWCSKHKARAVEKEEPAS